MCRDQNDFFISILIMVEKNVNYLKFLKLFHFYFIYNSLIFSINFLSLTPSYSNPRAYILYQVMVNSTEPS